MSVGLPSTTRGVCREVRFCFSAGKSNLYKTFCSDLSLWSSGWSVEFLTLDASPGLNPNFWRTWVRERSWLITNSPGFIEAAGHSSWSLLHAGVCVCVRSSISLFIGDLSCLYQTSHSWFINARTWGLMGWLIQCESQHFEMSSIDIALSAWCCGCYCPNCWCQIATAGNIVNCGWKSIWVLWLLLEVFQLLWLTRKRLCLS